MKRFVSLIVLGMLYACLSSTLMAQTAKVQIIHNSPDPLAASVDIYVNGSVAVPGLDFREATGFIDLPINATVAVGIAGTPAPIPGTDSTLSLTANETYVFIANGLADTTNYNSTVANDNGQSIGFQITQFAGHDTTTTAGSTAITAAHGSTDADSVDVLANGGVLVDNISYPVTAGPLTVPTDLYLLQVTPYDDNNTIVLGATFIADLAGLNLDGEGIVVFASGFVDPANNANGPGFGLFAVTRQGGQAVALPTTGLARGQIIHNAADPAAALVDVYVNTLTDTIKFDDVAFRSATTFLNLPSGYPLDIRINLPTSTAIDDQPVDTFAFAAADSETYAIVANGVLDPTSFDPNPDAVATDFTLLVEAGVREAAVNAGDVDLKILHGATDAPSVGVNANGATVVPTATYTDFTGYLSVPPAAYVFDVTPANTPGTVIAGFYGDLSGLAGGAATVFASGFLDPSTNQSGEAFGLFAALPDGTVIELPPVGNARAQVIHNSADPAAAVVDLYVDIVSDTVKFEDVPFRGALPFADLPAGYEIEIGVAPSNSTDITQSLATFPATLTNDSTYVIVASGVLDPASFAANPGGIATAFTLLIDSTAQEAAATAGNVDLKVLHGSTDTDAVGVNANGATVVPAAAYTDFTGYLSVPPAEYIFDVTPANTPGTTLAGFYGDLSGLAGGAATVFASGFFDPAVNQNGEALGLFAALPDGTVIELPPVGNARAQVIHNSADPAAAVVDLYVDIVSDTVKFEDVPFRGALPFADLPAGYEIEIGVAPSNSTDITQSLATFPATLTNDSTYVIVASGVLDPASFAANPGGIATAFTLLIDSTAQEAAATAGNVDLKVLHGSTDTDAVGVNANGATVVPAAAYTDFTGYLSVPPAEYIFDVTPANTPGTTLAGFYGDLSGLAGGAATVFASGFFDPAVNQNGEALGLFAALPDGTVIELPPVGNARAQVIHNSADPAAAVVDLYVDIVSDTVKFEDVPFRGALPFADLPAGYEIEIGVAPSNSTDITQSLATFPATLTNDSTYVIVASGVLDPASFEANPEAVPTAFTLLIDSTAREAAATAGNVDLKILHGATDAPAVGVNANGATVVPTASYTDFTGYLSVAPREYVFDVTPGGTPGDILAGFYGDLTTLSDGAATVFASGFLTPANDQDGEAFGLFAALPDGTVLALQPIGKARAQVIHNAADLAANTVDIYVDILRDTVKFEDVPFRGALPFADLPTDYELDIVIAGPNSTGITDAVVGTFPATLEDGESYYVIAQGILAANIANYDAQTNGAANIEFGLVLESGAREEADDATMFDLNVFHGSTDAPAVDITADQGLPPLLSNLSYGNFTGYNSLMPAEYELGVGANPVQAITDLIAAYTADISGAAGGAGLILASGFLTPEDDPTGAQNGAPFGLLFVQPDGSADLLPLATSIKDLEIDNRLIRVYPNPMSGAATLSYQVKEAGAVSIELFDAQGRRVMARQQEQVPGNYETTLDARALSSGVHLVVVTTASTRSVQRVMVK